MKRMISNILLAVLVISAVPMHASLGQTVQNGTRTVLQGMGNNPGRIALCAGGLTTTLALYKAYKVYCGITSAIANIESKGHDKLSSTDKSDISGLKSAVRFDYWLIPVGSAIVGTLAAGVSYLLAKSCGWAGSKI